MNNPTPQSSPALAIKPVSIICIVRNASDYATDGKLLTIGASATAHYVEYLLLLRLILLIHLICRNAQSITMITDGRGNVISGGNNGGKSHISYTPYGSIHRTDSSGPDITRFKFTGQEEDKESGLLYYKARYYDPMLGRFLQADNVTDIDETYGMNPYMYVEGNPVRYRDPTGHSKNNPMLGAIIGYAVAEQFGLSKEQGAMLGGYAGSGKTTIAKDMKRGLPAMLMFNGLMSGDPNARKFAAMLMVGMVIGGGRNKTWFNHNYTGDGNRDPFAKLNSNHTDTRSEARETFIAVFYILNDNVFKDNPITLEQAVTFLALAKMMSPRPKSYSDELSQGHDRDVPGTQLTGSPQQHLKADFNYIKGYLDGFRTGKIFRQPADIIIGAGGVLGLSIDARLEAIRVMVGHK